METYNGSVVTPSQKIKAVQDLPQLERDLYLFSEQRKHDKKKKEREMEEERARRQANGEKEDDKKPYTKESRREMYYDMAKDKERKER